MTNSVPFEDLCERLLARNPFTDNRVNSPSDEAIDVPSLHGPAFDRLTGLAREALAARRGIGAMLWGEAGIGKSHLLGRLDRWARSEGNACSVYLHNLQAAPANLPRTLLRAVLDRLSWSDSGALGASELCGLIHEAAKRSLGARHVSWINLRQGLLALLAGDGPADAALADQTVVDVLFRYFRSIHLLGQRREDGSTARAALRWLRGDALTPPQAGLLGLPPGRTPETPIALEDSQQMKLVLAVLTRLAAACDRPFLLLFDQVDNLEEDQASALSRFLEALIDSSRNLLVVTAGIQATLADWRQRKIIQDSAWDRLAQVQVQLLKLTPSQARLLIEKRLENFFQMGEEIPEVQRLLFDDSLFPLGRHWFQEDLEQRFEVRPREAISLAGEAWYREQQWLAQEGIEAWLANWQERVGGQGGTAPPSDIDETQLHDLIDRAIHNAMSQHAAARRGLPPDGDSLIEAVVELLEEESSLDPSASLVALHRGESLTGSPYDLLLIHETEEGEERTTGVVMATGLNAYQMAPRLAKLAADTEPPHHVLLICSENGPNLGARGEEYLRTLEQRPNSTFELLRVPSVELITLDALHAIWNLARSEDLDVSLPGGQSQVITPEEVIDSHLRQGRFQDSRILSAALTLPPPPPSSPGSGEVALADEQAAEQLVEEALFTDPIHIEQPESAIPLAEPVLAPALAEPVSSELGLDTPMLAPGVNEPVLSDDGIADLLLEGSATVEPASLEPLVDPMLEEASFQDLLLAEPVQPALESYLPIDLSSEEEVAGAPLLAEPIMSEEAIEEELLFSEAAEPIEEISAEEDALLVEPEILAESDEILLVEPTEEELFADEVEEVEEE